jgi:2-polyprenyl-6-methoxyphenol hydroxylase-like FAD-dependent oxidoreductase
MIRKSAACRVAFVHQYLASQPQTGGPFVSLQFSQIDETESGAAVLIVGTGPAGLFAACELVRHGVRPRVVERRLAPHHEARGTALQPATLEVVERAGLIEPFLHAGVRIRQAQLLGPGLREISTTRFAGIGCKYEFQCSLPQWQTETILRDRLQSLGVTIEYGTEVKSIEDDPAGLRVMLESGGQTESFTAAYALGAGGAHSVTRHSMQEHLDGATYDGRFIVADAKIRLGGPPDCSRVIVGPTGFGLFSPLPGDRRLIFVNRNETDTRPELPTVGELATLLNARVGIDIGLHDLQWISYFKMHKRAAERSSDGRRFLLGDAAHLSSPLGGEGLNAAFMDAADIAWKLPLVIRGEAKPSLLDSYAAERGIADRHVLEVSDEVHSSVMNFVALCDGGAAPAAHPADPAADMAAARRRSMLDISLAGSALVGQAGGGGNGLSPGTRFPGCHLLAGTSHHLIAFGEVPRLDYLRSRWGKLVSIVDTATARFDAATAGLSDREAILVRPDGFVGFRADPADEKTMDALDAHLAAYLIPNAGAI